MEGGGGARAWVAASPPSSALLCTGVAGPASPAPPRKGTGSWPATHGSPGPLPESPLPSPHTAAQGRWSSWCGGGWGRGKAGAPLNGKGRQPLAGRRVLVEPTRSNATLDRRYWVQTEHKGMLRRVWASCGRRSVVWQAPSGPRVQGSWDKAGAGNKDWLLWGVMGTRVHRQYPTTNPSIQALACKRARCLARTG